MMDEQENTLVSMYKKLEETREPYLRRARKCAEITIPSLFPEEGHTQHNSFISPNQSFGAQGTNVLASKILIALLPPNVPFFKYTINRYKLLQDTDPDMFKQLASESERAFAQIERSILGEIESSGIRPAFGLCIKFMIVGGNALLYVPSEGKVKVFRLDSYVVKRDTAGNILKIITKETVDIKTMPELAGFVKKDENDDKDEIDLYTGAILQDDGKWKVSQEIDGTEIKDTVGYYNHDELPFIPLRYSALAGEDYGRGLVEEYYGSLNNVDVMEEMLREGAVALARTLMVIDPRSNIDLDAFEKTPNMGAISGAVSQGRMEHVGVLEIGKHSDFNWVLSYMNQIKEELKRAFMMTEAIQREAERVTSTEVRIMAQELETTLGGVYSLLAQEMQLPLLKAIEARLDEKGELPVELKKLSASSVKPVIVAGMDALGRNADLSKIIQLQQILTPQEMQFINHEEMLKRKIMFAGITNDGLVRDADEVRAEQQQQQQQQQLAELASRAAPETIKQIGNRME